MECVEVCAASGSAALRDVRGYTVEAVEVLCGTPTALAGTASIKSPAQRYSDAWSRKWGWSGPWVSRTRAPIWLEGVHGGDWNASRGRSR